MFPHLFMKKRNEQPVVDKEIGDVGDVGGVGSEKEKHLNEIQLFMDILNNMGENHTIRGLYNKIRGIYGQVSALESLKTIEFEKLKKLLTEYIDTDEDDEEACFFIPRKAVQSLVPQ